MNEKQQQLIFDKGITNVPSDHICPDNALEDAYNLIYNNGQHHVIQKPATYMTAGTGLTLPDFLYVHRFNDEARYIGIAAISITEHQTTRTRYDLVWGTRNDSKKFVPDVNSLYLDTLAKPKVTSVGKTLIMSDNNGIHYFLWKDSGYEYLGDTLPRPEVEFKLGDRNDKDYKVQFVTTDIIYYSQGVCLLAANQQQNWNNVVVGLYSEAKRKIQQDKKFRGSFCVRAALELYDGTYYHISNPIFMLNHFSAFGAARIQGTANPFTVTMHEHGQNLYYRFYQDYTKWNDIIKNVVLFVTKEADIFDTTVDALLNHEGSTLSNPSEYFMSANKLYADTASYGADTQGEGVVYEVLQSIPDSDLSDTIKEGVYYKLCEIGLIGNAVNDTTWHNVAEHFNTHTLETLSAQPQLGEDDYFSHCPLKANVLYPYNSRLNLASVQRGFFDGFDSFMPFDTTLDNSVNTGTYTFYVTIRTDKGDVVVSHKKNSNGTADQIQGIYFYYPDPRAKKVMIKKGSSFILEENLTEHPTLHGAYYFAGVEPTMVEPTISGTQPDAPEPSSNPFELLPNYVITSEANNPFVFKAEGENKVGTGKIIGLATTTMALSQDAYGRTDLMVFSDSGIWGMAVDKTGLFQSIHPFSREVCNNADSITQTDGAIFFSSAKGLMMATDAGVKCVSTQLSGKTPSTDYSVGHFCDYLEKAFFAYDYRDSLLWLFNNDSTRSNLAYHYVYSIRSGAFSKAYFLSQVTEAISDYPDSLIQQGNTIYSMRERLDINLDESTYPAVLVSRPLKLENAIALKTIMHAKHILDITSEAQSSPASLAWKVEASNNTKVWVPLSSLTGMPWKYYRFTYTFTNLRATDTFSGTLVVTQERRTNKMR